MIRHILKYTPQITQLPVSGLADFFPLTAKKEKKSPDCPTADV